MPAVGIADRFMRQSEDGYGVRCPRLFSQAGRRPGGGTMTTAASSKNGETKRFPRSDAELLDRLPPVDFDAERMLLGSLLLAPERLSEIGGTVGKNSFYDERHKALFEHIQNAPAEALDNPKALSIWLTAEGVGESCGGAEYLIYKVAQSVAHSGGLRFYAEAVAKYAVKRAILDKTRTLIQSCYAEEFTAEDCTRQAAELAAGSEIPAVGEPPAFAKLIDSATLAAWDIQPEFLVNGILVKGQPAAFGGRSKTLKTGLAIDLAISLGSGTPFLGSFTAKKCNVAIWSGESGISSIRNTAMRVAAARGVSLSECSISWAFDLPRLSRDIDLDEIKRIIEAREIDVVIFDPLYICLLDGNEAQGASNVFFMGSKLIGLSQLAQATGVTPIVLHHFKKTQSDENEPCTLEDLSQAGVAEWTRQWLLLARAEPYQHDGIHRLFMRSGGSAGFGGLYRVDVAEGVIDGVNFSSGRKWETSVAQAGDFRGEKKRQQEQRKAERQEALEGEHRQRLLAVLKNHPVGETARVLREESGLNTANFGKAITTILKEGRAESCEVIKRGSKYEGYISKN
ncbi:MAG: AAA family ATPase [Pirellulales bacterium]|nr:AAA family ATPase [Pirellulales bacterium]